MSRRTWTPINPDGSVNEAELGLPWDTAEPTTWEAIAPKVGNGYSAFIAGALRRAELCPRHRFWLLFGGRLPVSPFPENVTIAAGPIASQAEADRVLPALLAVKAARREAVFAPREVIDLEAFLWGAAPDTASRFENGHLRRSGAGGQMVTARPLNAIHAVRVRGDHAPMLPDHVRLLRDQAAAAGVPFSLAWGEWAPVAMPHAWFDGSREVVHVNGEMRLATWSDLAAAHSDWQGFERWGAARTGCSLDGVDYPEDDL